MRYAIPDWRMLENWCTRRSSCFYGLGEIEFWTKTWVFFRSQIELFGPLDFTHDVNYFSSNLILCHWAEGLGYRMEQNRMSTIMVVKILIWILWFYDLIWPKRFGSFKDLCNCSGLVGLYNSNDLKRSLFLVIFFNLT